MKRIGDPLDKNTLCGPLHNEAAVHQFKQTVEEAVKAGGKIEFGGKVSIGCSPLFSVQYVSLIFSVGDFQVMQRPGYFVEPTIISGLKPTDAVVLKETFAPIVYILKCNSLDEGILMNNNVMHGLSSSLFTKDISALFKVRIF